MNSNEIRIHTPEQISLQFRLAGLGSKATAFLIDLILILIFQIAVVIAVTYLMGLFNITSGYLIAGLMIFLFVLFWGYFALFEFFSAGKTLGKMLLGIRVIQENGQNLTFLSAFVRNLLLIVDFLPTLFLVGILLIFFHPKHKRLGDLAAGTLVVHERQSQSKRQKRALNKEIERRGIDLDQVRLDDWTKKKVSSKEWELLKTYVQRRNVLTKWKHEKFTHQVAEILYPTLNQSIEKKQGAQLEAELLAFYDQLREEWEYELGE